MMRRAAKRAAPWILAAAAWLIVLWVPATLSNLIFGSPA
jgi:hypothetical protein